MIVTECNAGYIILEKKKEFIVFQLQVVRYNFKQKGKCNADNFNQIPQFIVSDIVWDTNPCLLYTSDAADE